MNKKYELKNYNKTNKRLFIPMDDLNKFNITADSTIYYTVFFDVYNMKKRFYISDKMPNGGAVIFTEQKVIKINSIRSKQLVFYFDNTYNLIFNLKNKNYAILNENVNEEYLFEIVFI